MAETAGKKERRIGLALGSGSARGWAHIGVLRALAELGIEPDIVCGTSIGALVGAFYVTGKLDALEKWVLSLTTRSMIRFLDINMASRGGFVEGERLLDYFRQNIGEIAIEDLPLPFAAVATSLHTGQEIWFTSGSLLNAVRASISLPGIFTPVVDGDRVLVDGGLVNPVPVAVCRALGARTVIAVNLNGQLLGRRQTRAEAAKNSGLRKIAGDQVLAGYREKEGDDRWFGWINTLKEKAASLVAGEQSPQPPGLLDVLSATINVMQDRITRSRMAGDPPDVILAPRLGHLDLLDFDRAEATIAEGRTSVKRASAALQDLLEDQSAEDTMDGR